jgi:RNA polymerase sigma factor (sigma-70 family)
MSLFARAQFDDDLVARLRRGDRAAARAVYDRLAPAVYTLAARILGDRGAAAEVTQDTFVDVIEKAGRLERAGALSAWVRRIAVNHCLARLRSPWHRRRVSLPDGALEATEEALPADGERRDLDAALAGLPADARFVVWMHDVEGHTHGEIAAALGRTESFSKSQLVRARRRLKEWFDDADAHSSNGSGHHHGR